MEWEKGEKFEPERARDEKKRDSSLESAFVKSANLAKGKGSKAAN